MTARIIESTPWVVMVAWLRGRQKLQFERWETRLMFIAVTCKLSTLTTSGKVAPPSSYHSYHKTTNDFPNHAEFLLYSEAYETHLANIEGRTRALPDCLCPVSACLKATTMLALHTKANSQLPTTTRS